MTFVEKLKAEVERIHSELTDTLASYGEKVTNEKYERILELQKELKKAKAELAKWT